MKARISQMVTLLMAVLIFVENFAGFRVYADENDDYTNLYNQCISFYETMESTGIEYEYISDLLAYGYKGENFWDAEEDTSQNLLTNDDVNRRLFEMNHHEGEDIALLDGDYYDGNPPHDAREQASRMSYIMNVYDKYYNDGKHDRATYLTYLYISHYTENINYDRTATTPNFNQIFAHIISKNDIVYFNRFIENSQFADAANAIKRASDVRDSVKGIFGLAGNAADLACQGIEYAEINYIDAYENLKSTIDAMGLSEDEQEALLKKMKDIYKENYSNSVSESEIIDKMNIQLAEVGGGEQLAKKYATLMSTILKNSANVDILGSALSCTVAAVDLLSTGVSAANLAQLYNSYSVRRADRASIYYGLDPLP